MAPVERKTRLATKSIARLVPDPRDDAETIVGLIIQARHMPMATTDSI
jgi:hypothetical protein